MLNLLVYKFVVHALVYIRGSIREEHGPDMESKISVSEPVPDSETIFLTLPISARLSILAHRFLGIKSRN